MAQLDVFYIDELIETRHGQHGGGRGAPEVVDGHRVGASINRSAIALLSAQLQTFVEDVFFECAADVLPHLQNGDAASAFRRSFARWGNPSADNIRSLFNRLGANDVLNGLSWRKCPNQTVRDRLRNLNEIRNGVAHGVLQLRANNQAVSLTLVQVKMYRTFCVNFAAAFPAHALAAIR